MSLRLDLRRPPPLAPGPGPARGSTSHPLLLLLGRIAQHAPLLRDALHEPHADGRVPRVHEADVVLHLVQRLGAVVDQQPERLAQPDEGVLRRGQRWREWVRQQYPEGRGREGEEEREVVVAVSLANFVRDE